MSFRRTICALRSSLRAEGYSRHAAVGGGDFFAPSAGLVRPAHVTISAPIGNPVVARRALMADASVEIFRAWRVISLADPQASSGQSPEPPEAFAVLGERIVGTGTAEDLQARF